MFRTTLALAAVITALTAACSSKTDDADSASITKSCVQNACDQRMASDNGYCSRCLDACASADFDCDPSESCQASCSPSRACSDSERSTCVKQGFTVELPKDASSELESACRRMFQHYDDCGVKVRLSPSVCKTWAKTERPERAKDYDCVANLGCTDDESACDVAPTDFGDRVCDAMGNVCDGFCSDDLRSTLGADGAWLKASVADAVMTCAKQSSCSDARDCFDAWATAADL